MNFRDQDSLAALISYIERHQPAAVDGWIEQTDDEGRLRVLLASVIEPGIEEKLADGSRSAMKHLSIFRVTLAGHWTSPIYYVFDRKGPQGRDDGDGADHHQPTRRVQAKTARYILCHQPDTDWNRYWFCETDRRSVPHVGTYKGDLGLVGATFRPVEMV